MKDHKRCASENNGSDGPDFGDCLCRNTEAENHCHCGFCVVSRDSKFALMLNEFFVPIIISMVDTDLYKLSQQQAYWHQYPTARGKWKFTCRNKGIKLGFLKDQVREQIMHLGTLQLTSEEADYLSELGYFKEDYIEWLLTEFHMDVSNIIVECDEDGQLVIETEGLLTGINLLEVPILAIVNELYFRHDLGCRGNPDLGIVELHREGEVRLLQKISTIKDFPGVKFAEFGTRRRHSKMWQDFSVKKMVELCPDNIIGTSNVALAMKHGIKAIGTVAHEWYMSHLGLVDRLEQAQSRALHVWRQEYGDQLGIALSDTFTTDAFLKDFDFPVARAYDGVRQDSGDPIVFGEKMIAHYKKIGIDPRRKYIVFSDSLTMDKAIRIWKHFAGRIGVSFGIGTHLSNDLGVDAINIVMKLIICNGVDLVKLSDDLGKTMGVLTQVVKVKKAYGVV